MNYEEFKRKIKEEIKKKTDGGANVQILAIPKNNGLILDGLSIVKKNNFISPTIYLDSFYNSYQSGMKIEEIAGEIIEINKQHQYCGSLEPDFYKEYEKVKSTLRCKLINYEKNKKLLERVPHIPFLDLAVVFYCLLEEFGMPYATILIYHNHLEIWNQKLGEILWQAKTNTLAYCGYEFENIYKTMEIGMEGKCEGEERVPMYVLTNRLRTYGAACILYEEILEGVGEFFKEDYFILPSSVHEVIAVPVSFARDKGELKNIVKEVNQTCVDAEEILSDHVYFYKREEKSLYL